MSLCSLFLITHYLYHSINPCLYPTDIPTILFFVNLSLFKIPSWHPHTWHNHHRLPKVFFVFCMEEDGVHYGVLWYVIEWQLRSVETWGQDSKKVKLTECVLIATNTWIVMLIWQTYVLWVWEANFSFSIIAWVKMQNNVSFCLFYLPLLFL